MTITVTVEPGGVLKREIVEQAFDDLGISDYEPDEAVKALKRLNAMALEAPWNALAYEQPTYSEGLLTDESGVPRDYLAAFATELASRIAPIFGKTLSAEQKRNAVVSRNNFSAAVATIPTASFAPGTPAGAGSRSRLTYLPTDS
jgi:hypothetical protein